MDPIAFAVLCGIGSGIVGYLVGGALFNATWKLLARSKAKQMQEVSARDSCSLPSSFSDVSSLSPVARY